MVIHQLSYAHDSCVLDLPVRGKSVRTPGPMATLPDALLVHDVGLTTQAGLVGRKGSTGIRAALRMEGVWHSILSNWMLRTRVDQGSVGCVNRVGEVQTGQDTDEFLLVG